MRVLLALCLLPPVLCLLHESRRAIPPSYTPLANHTVPPSTPLPTSLRIFLTQSNLDTAPAVLGSISDPASPTFRQHWSREAIADHFAPSDTAVQSVLAWLADEGVPASRITASRTAGWVDVRNSTVGEASRLLNTTYTLYTHSHSHSRAPHLACTEYHLPAHVAPHVDLVTPTLHFDSHMRRQGQGKSKSLGAPGSGSLPKQGAQLAKGQAANELAICGYYTVPACLEKLYDIPAPALSSPPYPSTQLGIVEYTPQSYLPADLDLFAQYYLPPAVGVRPQLYAIDGGVLQGDQLDFQYQGESDLDLQYAMALSWPGVPALYQVGDISGLASFNNFLDGIDGSYCTYDGGDDPNSDEVFPNPGYPHPADCGTVPTTSVISTSYNYNEYDLTPAYEQRQCNEYLKLGLHGITVVFSSGDFGVAANDGTCYDPSTGAYDGTAFVPSFPSTCPWVTSVGATQFDYSAAAASPFAQPEIACQEVITSGGGFSTLFARPAYQVTAVDAYLSANPVPEAYAAQGVSTDGTRAFPDVSANGANFVVAVDGEFNLVFGTSASAPVVASMIARINEELAACGQASIGFINPTLYANPQLLNDIVSGSNPGCGTDGFSAAQGWDPVTGMGTINYTKLRDFYIGFADAAGCSAD